MYVAPDRWISCHNGMVPSEADRVPSRYKGRAAKILKSP